MEDIKIDQIFIANQNLRDMALKNLEIEREILDTREQIFNVKKKLQCEILDEKNKFDKPIYSNQLLRDREFDHRIEKYDDYLMQIKKLKELEETEKINRIKINYIVEDLINMRLYLKIKNEIKS